MGVIDVETRAISGHHVGHTQGIRVHHGHRVVALEIEAAAIAQWVLLPKIPAGARTGMQGGISHNSMGGGHNR